MILGGVLLVLILAANCHHECDPALAKLKSELSRKIDQSLYKYYDLQAQAKTNNRQMKKIVNKVHPSLLNDCYVDDKLSTLYGIILEYQRLLSGVTSSYNSQKTDDYFEKTKSEIEQNNARYNPNNYAEWDIHFIKEDFEKKIGGTFYDVLVLKVHVNVNAQFVEDAIDAETDRLINDEDDAKCRHMLTIFKHKARDDCQMEQDFDLLEKTRSKFARLKEVACFTLEICEELNPLLTQGEGLEKCELSKIVDLRRQGVVVSEEFEMLKKKLFEDHDRCIRDLMGTAFASIAEIVYGTCRKDE